MSKKIDVADYQELMRLLFATEANARDDSVRRAEVTFEPVDVAAFQTEMRSLGMPEWWIQGKQFPEGGITSEPRSVQSPVADHLSNVASLKDHLAQSRQKHSAQIRKPMNLRAAAADSASVADSADKNMAHRHPDQLETLEVLQGQITFWDGGAETYVTFGGDANPSILELGFKQRAYSLKPSDFRLGFFEVEDLSPADANEFITSHLQAPERFPVAWR